MRLGGFPSRETAPLSHNLAQTFHRVAFDPKPRRRIVVSQSSSHYQSQSQKFDLLSSLPVMSPLA